MAHGALGDFLEKRGRDGSSVCGPVFHVRVIHDHDGCEPRIFGREEAGKADDVDFFMCAECL